MSAKIATAVLEIRTDTGQFFSEMTKAEKGGLSLGNVFAQVGKIFGIFSDNVTKGGADAGKAIDRVGKQSQQSAKGAGTAIEGWGVSFGKLVASYISAEAIIGAATGLWNAFTGEISSSIKAAGDAEKAHVQLAAALRAQGTAAPSVIAAYQQYASELERTTVFQDDALEGAMALLVQVGNVMPRDMKAALTATTELASGLGIDLTSAAMLVSKAAEGNFTSLKKVGVVLDETKVKSEGFGGVLDAITAKFGGQAAAIAGTYEGRLAQLGNAWNNVEESIGRAITTNATVLDLLGRLTGALQTNTGELRDNATVADLISGAVILVVQAYATFIQALDISQTAYFTARQGSDFLAKSLVETGIAALEGAKYFLIAQKYLNPAMWLGMSDGIQTVDDALVYMRGMVQGLSDDSKEAGDKSKAWGSTLAGLSDQAKTLAGALETTRGKTVDLNLATDTGTDAWGRHTTAVYNATDAEKAYAKALEDVLSFSTPWYDTLNTINGAVVEGAKYYITLGASAEEVGKMYGFTKGQIDAVVASMKLEKTMTDAAGASYADLTKWLEAVAAQRRALSNAAFETNITAEVAARRSAADIIAKQTLSATDYQVFQINREFDEKKAALDRSLGDTERYYAALAALEDERQAKLNDALFMGPIIPPTVLADRVKAADEWRKSLDDVANALVQLAQVSGDSFGGMIQWIAQTVVSWNAAAKAAENYAKATTAAGKAAAVMQGISAVASATSQGSSGQRAASGALAGAQAGAMFGPWGAAIGAGVGALVGWVRGMDAAEKATNKARQAFVDGAGGLAALNQAAAEAGVTLKAFLDAKDPEAYAAALKDLQAALDKVAETKALLSEASSLYGPSQADLDAAVVKAKKIFDAMDASGQYTQDQLNKAYRAWQQAMADAGDSAAQAWLDMQDGVTKASSAAQAAIDDLVKTRDALMDSYKNEAPEEEMGSIETAARSAVDAINKQIADQQAAMAAAGETQGDLIAGAAADGERVFTDAAGGITDALTTSARDSASAFSDAFDNLDLTVKVKVDWDTTGPPGARPPGIPGYAEGGSARFTRPTLIMVGEAGTEDAIFSGGGRSFNRSPGSAAAGMSAAGIESRLDGLRNDLSRHQADLPKVLARAIKIQMQLA